MIYREFDTFAIVFNLFVIFENSHNKKKVDKQDS